MKQKLIFIFVCLAFFVECKRKPESITAQPPLEIKKENLISMNQKMMRDESAEIKEYMAAHHLEMNTSGTGLRYRIEKGKGAAKKPTANQVVEVAYTLDQLDGTTCYSFTEEKPFTFTTGRAEIARGIEELVLKMSEDDKAICILPSHLGYGTSGDGAKIPPTAILICRIHLLKIKI